MVGGTTQTTNYKLQGSNDGTNYTDLMSPGTTTGATSEIVTVTAGITTSTAYRYHRVIFNANGADNYYVCELELYESGTYAIGPNDWTLNNISVTTGTTYDSMLDVPLGSGGSERGNYCTLNPISTSVASYVKEAGLSLSGNSTGQYPGVGGTMYVSTGKWYWEYIAVAGGTLNCTFGFSPQLAFGGTFQTATGAVGYTNDTGAITVSGGTVTTGASFTSGDIIGVALDCGAGTAQFYKNNSATGALVTGLTGAYTPAMNLNYYPSNTIYLNCGQRPFTYTPPTGFLALHTGNFSVPTIRKPNQYFDASLFTGNGTSQSIVNSGAFQPDFVWLKSRNNARSHALYDSVRGRAAGLLSDGTNTEVTSSSGNDLASFNTNGFTVGPVQLLGSTNTSGDTIVAWQWKAGESSVSNTAGSITSQVSANTTNGFSIVTYTGNGSGSATVGHGLGVVPKLVICKPRSGSGSWHIKHFNLTAGTNLYFTTSAQVDASTLGGGGGLVLPQVQTSPFRTALLMRTTLMNQVLPSSLTALLKLKAIQNSVATQETEVQMDHLYIVDLDRNT